DVVDLPHVAGDHQNLVSLKFHKRGRRDEPVYCDRAPANLAEDIVHFLDPWNALERDSGIEQTLEINFVGVLAEEKSVLPHDKTPDGMIDRRVIVVTLVDRELEQMLRQRLNRLVR